PNTDHYPELVQALKNARYEDVWIIGGATLYREAINYCTVLDITYVPDQIEDESAIRFPNIDWSRWVAGPKIKFQENEHLFRQQFTLR
ncbi:MAG: dihydrofolate reductase, partial [Gammaproteobacteria bacterium]|nr:dihydrofolate reductase [Gammaproteobacteria bacterium]